ncbi:ankyrin repeat domain-containing protein [Pseudomonas sp. DWP3-1-2]|uniref:ankyrin repeat domain-containing protein n=1 Tax=Pseudomonas sp. DWP3-1-2 TaxID=2804645 RepID=UPI003CEB7AB6
MRQFMCVALLCIASSVAYANPPADPSADTQGQLRALFFEAARDGRQDMLTEFINAGFDLNVQDDKGYTALILAAYHGQQGAVTQLLNAGADPCAKDLRGNTALMGAIFKGELSIANQLVAADCAPDQRNNAGQTAAMYAALFHRKDVLDALAAKGADLNATDAMGNQVQSLERGEFQPLQPSR